MMHVSTDDARAVTTVVRDVCECWDDPTRWRHRLLLGACRLIAGTSAALTAQTLTGDGRFGEPIALAVVGLADEVRRSTYDRVIEQTRDQPVEDVALIVPGYERLFADFAEVGAATAARGDIVADSVHYASPFHTHFRAPAGCDDYVSSIRSVDVPRRVEILMVDRPTGADRFESRDVAMIRLLHDEIAPLVGVRLATEDHLSRDGLSRRLRETLDQILVGRSEKEAAAALGVETATVHGYVGTLYRHFKVHTRAELMAYFVLRQPLQWRFPNRANSGPPIVPQTSV